jgi:hypothetical protein
MSSNVALLMQIPIRRKPSAGGPLPAQANKKGAEAPLFRLELVRSEESAETGATTHLSQFSKVEFNKFLFYFNDLLDDLVHGRPLFR